MQRLEALLFSAGRSLRTAEISRVLEIAEEETLLLAERLEESLRQRESALWLKRGKDDLELVTRSEWGALLARFRGEEEDRLSAAALETLAVVAYHQPVSRGGVEALRGVNSERSLAVLLEKGWIAVAEPESRPRRYRTADAFLHRLGLQSLEDLLPLQGALREKGRMPVAE